MNEIQEIKTVGPPKQENKRNEPLILKYSKEVYTYIGLLQNCCVYVYAWCHRGIIIFTCVKYKSTEVKYN